jgi:hypothetical protein
MGKNVLKKSHTTKKTQKGGDDEKYYKELQNRWNKCKNRIYKGSDKEISISSGYSNPFTEDGDIKYYKKYPTKYLLMDDYAKKININLAGWHEGKGYDTDKDDFCIKFFHWKNSLMKKYSTNIDFKNFEHTIDVFKAIRKAEIREMIETGKPLEDINKEIIENIKRWYKYYDNIVITNDTIKYKIDNDEYSKNMVNVMVETGLPWPISEEEYNREKTEIQESDANFVSPAEDDDATNGGKKVRRRHRTKKQKKHRRRTTRHKKKKNMIKTTI